MRNNRFLLALAGLLMLASVPVLGQSSISVESVDGAWHAGNDTVLTESQIMFRLRYTNGTGANVNISNGYAVYSTDGATWSGPVAGDTLTGAIPRSNWDLPFAMNVFLGAAGPAKRDTVGIIGAKIVAPGMPMGFNGIPYGVKIGSFATGDHGLHVCLDSTWFRPGGTWKWVATGINAFPAWAGPYCYTIVDTTQITDVTEIGGELPTSFALDQNYPNPFNPTTIINFDIPRNSKVNLTIYNVLGQAVKTLVDKDMTAGKYQADWDATSDAGNKVASGVYFYKIEAGDFVQTKKMMLLR